LDIVSVHGLTVETVIGILDWEQEIKQPLVIDLDMSFACAKAANSGKIDDALDYFAVSEAVTEWLQAQPWGLIETVAEVLAERIMARFSVQGIKICVKKPTAVPTAQYVAVTIERGLN